MKEECIASKLDTIAKLSNEWRYTQIKLNTDQREFSYISSLLFIIVINQICRNSEGYHVLV